VSAPDPGLVEAVERVWSEVRAFEVRAFEGGDAGFAAGAPPGGAAERGPGVRRLGGPCRICLSVAHHAADTDFVQGVSTAASL